MMAMANIELPKDAMGREIPLDTKVLYNEDGKCFKVNRFTYSVVQTIPGLKWGVVFMSCLFDYCRSFYLAPPEPLDSWEKLDEDLDRCIEADNLCKYYSPSGGCKACTVYNGGICRKDAIALKDIKKRIRKLRGEDE